MCESTEREEMTTAAITNYNHDAKGKRNDIHRPSAINPGDYEYLMVDAARKEREQGKKYAGPGGVCHHCGKAIVWRVHFKHTPTGKLVTFGYQCSALLQMTNTRIDHEMNLLKRRARRDEIEAKMALEKSERIRIFTESYPDIVEWMNDHNWDNERFAFLRDMQYSLTHWGYLTTAQAETTRRIIAKRIEKAQERLNEAQPTSLAPEDRQTVQGEILSVKFNQGAYAQTKMLVKLDDGNKVYGTMPESIESAIWPNDHDEVNPKGVRVEFTATFERNEDHFSFYRKPTKGRVI